jgi:hypothetical protein
MKVAAALPRYSNKHSPRRFSQQQLFAILALRQFFRTDYRGIVTLLADHSDLRRTLRLQRIPHFTTLHVASRRFEQTEIGEDYLRAQ